MKRALLSFLAIVAMAIFLNLLDFLPRRVTAPFLAEAASPELDVLKVEIEKLLKDMEAGAVLDKGWAAYRRGNYSTAYREWLPLAKRGNADAQFYIGAMHDEGIGVTQDSAEALKWWRLAAVQGNADAQINLGLKYEKGEGIRQDSAEALKWFRLAASQGIVRAQLKVAVIFLLGHIVPQDFSEALKWFRRAADQGNAFAQFSIGTLYGRGAGVPKDDTQTVKWYRLSADQGLAEAQYYLGIKYMAGEGAPQDHVLAHMWLNLAASRLPPGQGRDKAVEGRDLLSRGMTADQLAEAQRLAREWKPKSRSKLKKGE